MRLDIASLLSAGTPWSDPRGIPRSGSFLSAALRVPMKCFVSPNGPFRTLIVGKTSKPGKPNDVRNVPIMHAVGEQPSGRVGLLAVTRVHNARRLRVPDHDVDRALRDRTKLTHLD